MKLIILTILISLVIGTSGRFLSKRGNRDFVLLTSIATLMVTTCPSGGGGTISMYSSEACASAFDTSDDVDVFFICSGTSAPYTLTLYNAYASNSPYTGSFIITGYSFGSAMVTNGPAYFFSQSVTCSNDYCGNPYVSGCTTTSTQSSTTSGASIFVLQSGGEQTVDLCLGGSGSTCCSGVTTSSCPPPPSPLTQCSDAPYTGPNAPDCNCPTQTNEYAPLYINGDSNYCFPDADGVHKYCSNNAQCVQGSCTTTADCPTPTICTSGNCMFPSCSSDSDCAPDLYCLSGSACGYSLCFAADIGCTAKKREYSNSNSTKNESPPASFRRRGKFSCSQCASGKCRADCKVYDTNCCIPTGTS